MNLNFFYRFLRLSVPPLSNERPQMAMCDEECGRSLKCRATGLTASLSSSTLQRCSRKRLLSRLPLSPMYSFFREVQVVA